MPCIGVLKYSVNMTLVEVAIGVLPMQVCQGTEKAI